MEILVFPILHVTPFSPGNFPGLVYIYCQLIVLCLNYTTFSDFCQGLLSKKETGEGKKLKEDFPEQGEWTLRIIGRFRSTHLLRVGSDGMGGEAASAGAV